MLSQSTLFNLLNSFYACSSLADVNKVLHDSLVPLLKVDGVFTTRFNDLSQSTDIVFKSKVISTTSPNIMLFLSSIIVNNTLPSTPSGITICRNKNDKEQLFISNFQELIGVTDSSTPEVGVWFYIKRGGSMIPEFRIEQSAVEYLNNLKPTLIQTIRVILLKKEKELCNDIASYFIESDTAKAVITNQGTVLIGNSTFKKEVSLSENQPFSNALKNKILTLVKEKNSIDKEPKQLSFVSYRVKNRLYNINITSVNKYQKIAEKTWLLKFERVLKGSDHLIRVLKQSKITPRESELIFLLKQGVSIIDIAKRLNLSHHTIRTHIKNIYKKLNISSSQDLVALLQHTAS